LDAGGRAIPHGRVHSTHLILRIKCGYLTILKCSII